MLGIIPASSGYYYVLRAWTVEHHGDDSGFAPIPSDIGQMWCIASPCLGAD